MGNLLDSVRLRAPQSPFVIAIFIVLVGCAEPVVTYISMDREIKNGTISSADLIDQMTLSTGNGASENPIVIYTFNPEWFRCQKDGEISDLKIGGKVIVTKSANDSLYILDSFYGAKALAVKTDLGAEYYKQFRLEPGTKLRIIDGPYCYAKSIWWFVIARDNSSSQANAYLFGLVPESKGEIRFLEVLTDDE